MKKQEIKKFNQENITDWLKERSSGDMAYTEKAPKIKMEDQIGEMYYVTKPSKKSTMEELVGKGDVFEFATLGLTREDIHGIYKSEGKAKTVANKLIKERDTKLKETYKKGKKNLKQWKLQLMKLKHKLKVKCLKLHLTQI
jgi:hypothetical protein